MCPLMAQLGQQQTMATALRAWALRCAEEFCVKYISLSTFVPQNKEEQWRGISVLVMTVIDKAVFKCTIWLNGKHTEPFNHYIWSRN